MRPGKLNEDKNKKQRNDMSAKVIPTEQSDEESHHEISHIIRNDTTSHLQEKGREITLQKRIKNIEHGY